MWKDGIWASEQGLTPKNIWLNASTKGAWSLSVTQQIRERLFSAGQQGVMYVPQPAVDGQQVLYQDSAGTTPVTADGQPEGLMFDLRKGLARGPELVTNGDFSSGLDPWFLTGDAGSWSVENGKLSCSNANTNSNYAQVAVPVTSGEWYQVDFNVPFDSDPGRFGGITIRDGSTGNIIISAWDGSSGTGSHRAFFKAPLDPVYITIQNPTGVSRKYDNFSIKSISGNHATQATSAAKSLYKTTGLLQQYDGVDDVTNVTLPAIASATVITAKATGVVVQYPVDLSSGSYTITESHSGIIIREGQLSASEEQSAVDYLSGMQGVA